MLSGVSAGGHEWVEGADVKEQWKWNHQVLFREGGVRNLKKHIEKVRSIYGGPDRLFLYRFTRRRR